MGIVAVRLRDARRRAGLTLKQVGAAAGASASMMSQIESGKKNPSTELLSRLAEALGLELLTVIVAPHRTRRAATKKAVTPKQAS